MPALVRNRSVPNIVVSNADYERLTDLAGRLFFDTAPTLSAIGPVEHLVSLDEIAGALTQQPAGIRKAVG